MATLTQEQVNTLREVCYSFDGARPMSYSGRAMFGAQCLGIVLEGTEDIFGFALSLRDDDEELADILATQPSRVDGMGRERIVLYWEGVKTDGTDLSDDDEEGED